MIEKCWYRATTRGARFGDHVVIYEAWARTPEEAESALTARLEPPQVDAGEIIVDRTPHTELPYVVFSWPERVEVPDE